MVSSVTFIVLLLLLRYNPTGASCDGTKNFIACTPLLRQQQESNQVVTTTSCSQIRNPDEYTARLDLTYIYSLEYNTSTDSIYPDDESLQQEATLLLYTIERAVATSVASTLYQCNDQQQPIYAVEVSSPDNDHSISNLNKHTIIPYVNATTGSSNTTNGETATCPLPATPDFTNQQFNNTPTYECVVVRGVTSILLDGTGSSDSIPDIDKSIYTLIEATIQDVNFLNQFVLSQPSLQNVQLNQAYYVRSTGGNVIILSDPNKQVGSTTNSNGMSGTVKVAIVAAITSFCLTITIILLIIVCRQHKNRGNNDSEQQQSNAIHKNERTMTKHRRRSRYDPFSFEPLDDNFSTYDSEEPSPTLPSGWMIMTNHDASTENIPQPQPPNVRVITTTWSDLTSDSESIMSSLHLDRIDEEVGDCSFEYDDNFSTKKNKDDRNAIPAEQHVDENIEVGLEGSNFDDDMGSWPSSIRPISISRHHQNMVEDGNYNSLDLIADLNVSYKEDTYSKMSISDTNDEPALSTYLNIEVSLDEEIVISATNMSSTNEINIGEKHLNCDVSRHSFTFSSESESDKSLFDALDDKQPDNGIAEALNLPSGNFYDDDDYQSIEMCVVWMGDEGIKHDEENGGLFYEPTATTRISPPITEVLRGCRLVNDQDEDFSGREASLDESLTTVSIESNVVSKLPSSIVPQVTQPESDVTDSNIPFKNTGGAESTCTGEYSFPSSGAYRSVLEVNTNPTIVEKNANEEDKRNDRTVIALWAREIISKLMTGSPKMLECGTDFESNSNDTESSY
jgi:hypothetical protein